MKTISHKFVEFIPDNLENGVIYVSLTYRTVIHKCCCGCGNEVVTPLSPTDWQLIFNGETISLYPSVGNWNFDCKSHYWIKNNEIEWAKSWSSKEISDGRIKDSLKKEGYYNKKQPLQSKKQDTVSKDNKSGDNNFWLKIKKWL